MRRRARFACGGYKIRAEAKANTKSDLEVLALSRRTAISLIGLCLLLATSLSGCVQGCRAGGGKKPLGTAGGETQVIAFYENGWQSEFHGSSLPSFKKNVGLIDVVSPFWFTVGMDGSVEDKHNQEAMDFARANQIPVIALFNNKKGVVATNDRMLTDSTARAKSIARIVSLVDQYGYDGINIDYEVLPAKDKEAFTAYVAELAAQLKPKGKTIAVSVIPQVGTTADISGVYDFAALAQTADQIVLMAYNEHYPASAPGPVASTAWVDKNIKAALDLVPREKLILGVAVYGYDWPGAKPGTAETVAYIPMTEAAARAGKKGVSVQWDDEAQVPFYKYSEKGVTRQVWFENDQSLKAKLGLVRQYNLPGIAIWRIGFEGESVWPIIKEELGK